MQYFVMVGKQDSLILINTQLPHDFKWQVIPCHLGLYEEVEVKHMYQWCKASFPRITAGWSLNRYAMHLHF